MAFKFLKKPNAQLDRNIITYLICVAVATALWFLSTLNKDYTAEISYPVKYTNFPKGKYPVTELPSSLLLEVKAKGFALLAHRVRTSFLPITFNVSTYSNHLLEKDDVFEYTLYTNEIIEKIGSQLSTGITLLSIYPASIVFRLAKSESRKIAVRPIVNYTLKRQYILNNITTKPDSILVTAPIPILDTLRYLTTKPINLKDLGKSTSHTAELVPLTGCEFEDKEVDVDFHVEQFTEARKNVQITILNLPDSLTLRLFPDNVNLTYDVGLSFYDKINGNDFSFVVDYNQIQGSSFLNVEAKQIPPFIKNLEYTPQKVEYIIEKK